VRVRRSSTSLAKSATTIAQVHALLSVQLVTLFVQEELILMDAQWLILAWEEQLKYVLLCVLSLALLIICIVQEEWTLMAV